MEIINFWKLKRASILSLILISSSILGVVSALLVYSNEKLGTAFAIVITTIVLAMIVIMFIGIEQAIFLFLVSTLSFDIDFELYSQYHPGGLSPSVSINHYYILILIWSIVLLINRKQSLKIEYAPLELKLLIAFTILGSISGMVALNKVAFLYVFIRLIFLIILFRLSSRINLEKIWILLTLGLSFTVIFQLGVGLLQMRVNNSIGLGFLGEQSNPFRKGVSQLEQGLSGTLSHPSTFAFFMVLTIPIMLVGLNEKKTKNSNIMFKFIMICAILSAIVCTVLSAARTSILLTLLSFILFAIATNYIKVRNNINLIKVFLNLVLLLISLGILLIISWPLISERFFMSDFTRQFFDRQNLSYFSFNIIFGNIQNMIIGIGLNNYTDYLSKYGTGQFLFSHPVHNFYLLLWAEGGVFHLMTYLSLIVTMIVRMLRVIRHGERLLANKAVGVIIGLLATFIYNLTDWGLYHDQLFYFFIFYCILAAKIYREYKKKSFPFCGGNYEHMDVSKVQ